MQTQQAHTNTPRPTRPNRPATATLLAIAAAATLHIAAGTTTTTAAATNIYPQSPTTPAQANQPETFVTVAADPALLMCRVGSVAYPVATLRIGQTLRVVGTTQDWVRVEYPAGVNAYVPADGAQIIRTTTGQNKLRLTRPDKLMALMANAEPQRSYWPIFERGTGPAPGDEFTIIETVRAAGQADAEPLGYIIPAPTGATGWIRDTRLRPATQQEIATLRQPTTTPTQQPTTPTPTPTPTPTTETTQPTTPTTTPSTATPTTTPTTQEPTPTPTPTPAPTQPQPTTTTTPTTTQTTAPAPTPTTTTEPPTSPTPTPTPTTTQTQPQTPAPQPDPARDFVQDRVVADVRSLVDVFTRVQRAEVSDTELAAAITEFNRTINALTNSADPSDQRIAEALRSRLTVLQTRQSVREAMLESEAQAEQLDERAQQTELRIQTALTSGVFEMVGRLYPSAVYDGVRLPKMYRLEAGGGFRSRTIGYVAPTPRFNLETLVGRVVGVSGNTTFDADLQLRIITPNRIELLTIAGEATPIQPTPPSPSPSPLPSTTQTDPSTPTTNTPAPQPTTKSEPTPPSPQQQPPNPEGVRRVG